MAHTEIPTNAKPESHEPAREESILDLDIPVPDAFGSGIASVAIIGPDGRLRETVRSALSGCYEGAIREFATYPPRLDEVPELQGHCHDVVLIEIDSQPESALELIEGICSRGTATVMVYSGNADAGSSGSEMLVHCMRAGAREFFSPPFEQSAVAEALVRAAARSTATQGQHRPGGRQFLFMGTKGGCGVTTTVCNYAVAMAREGGGKTILIDLNLPLGDAALNLGLTAEYSTVNALQNIKRLDAQFLNKLLVQHESGLSVLAAPGKLPSVPISAEAVEHLLTVARHEFDNVIVDMGTGYELATPLLLSQSTIVYLITQAGLPELRNANRLITQRFDQCNTNYEIVLNRYESRRSGVSDQQMLKALTRQPKWKVPNDYAGVRRMQSGTGAFEANENAIYAQLQKMAQESCKQNLQKDQDKRHGFSFFGRGRGRDEKKGKEEALPITQLHITNIENNNAAQKENIEPLVEQETAEVKTEMVPQSVLQAEAIPPLKWDTPEPIVYGTRLGPKQLNATISMAGVFVYTPSDNYLLPAGTHTLWVSFMPRDVENPVDEMMQTSVTLIVNKATPILVWHKPMPIPQGTPLGAAQLNASSEVAGRFEYDCAQGTTLEEGIHTLQVQFLPDDSANYVAAKASVQIEITKKIPELHWPVPEPMTLGNPLTRKQLNAASPVSGSFTYTPAENTLLSAGEHVLSVVFTPEDSQQYAPAQFSVNVLVRKAVPVVQWTPSASLAYGDRLDDEQLNAKADISGSISYHPQAGSVLPVGEQKLSCVFTPDDSRNYESVQLETHLLVTKATPFIQWLVPDPIEYGTPLSNVQLNATTSIPGRMAYLPGAGAVLGAGTHTPQVQFIPDDESRYNRARASVALTVRPCKPSVQWKQLSPISYGTPLSSEQLCAEASVPGAFQYYPGEGEILPVGTHRLLVGFQPSDATNYEAVCTEVMLEVNTAKPIDIRWNTPAPISYGAALSEKQLNANAGIAGSFHYSPEAGEILSAGKHELKVSLVPEDKNLPVSQAHVQLTVEQARPKIHWVAPEPVIHGSPLAANVLNASADVAGSFVFAPTAGTVLPAGIHHLKAVFTPADKTNYSTEEASIVLKVMAQKPQIRWSNPAPILYGTPLGEEQLNATATVPGTFVYAPPLGTVMAEGKQMLLVTFMPEDHDNFSVTQAVVELVVKEMSELQAMHLDTISSAAEESARPVKTSMVLPEVKTRMEVKQTTIPAAAQKTPVCETRTYKGRVYEKGVDGQWHLQQE